MPTARRDFCNAFDVRESLNKFVMSCLLCPAVELETRRRRAMTRLSLSELERDMKKRWTRHEAFPGGWTA